MTSSCVIVPSPHTELGVATFSIEETPREESTAAG